MGLLMSCVWRSLSIQSNREGQSEVHCTRGTMSRVSLLGPEGTSDPGATQVSTPTVSPGGGGPGEKDSGRSSAGLCSCGRPAQEGAAHRSRFGANLGLQSMVSKLVLSRGWLLTSNRPARKTNQAECSWLLLVVEGQPGGFYEPGKHRAEGTQAPRPLAPGAPLLVLANSHSQMKKLRPGPQSHHTARPGYTRWRQGLGQDTHSQQYGLSLTHGGQGCVCC